MAKGVLIEEYHLKVSVPRKLSSEETRAIRRTLDSARFRKRVASAVRAIARGYRSLRNVTIALTR